MTVIIALASATHGVVASDGRCFGSAKIENGKVVQPADVDSDSFDKTFSVGKGEIIGAVAGLMSFSGRAAIEHIADVINGGEMESITFDAVIEKVREKIGEKLKQISDQEVLFSYRKLDLLLVAGENLAPLKLSIAAIRFFPSGNEILSTKDVVTPFYREKRFYAFGEDNAREAAGRALKNDHAPNCDIAFLKMLGRRAIQAGIQAAGVCLHGVAPACGGSVFVKILE